MAQYQPQRLYARGVIECGDCHEMIDLSIPVETWLERDDGDTVFIKAKVDQQADWQQPVWDHALNEHGPSL